MPKDKVVQGRPHPRPAPPGTPSPTADGAALRPASFGENTPAEAWHTTGRRTWRVLLPEARRMRRAPTAAEELLWKSRRNGALGVHFRRQHAIQRFIADFCCLKAKLVIEVDGPMHDYQRSADSERIRHLNALGFRVLRIPNQRIQDELPTVLNEIRAALAQGH